MISPTERLGDQEDKVEEDCSESNVVRDEPLNDSQLQIVYNFVDKMPSNRVKRNLNRDFSDGSYTAELIKYYLPK